MKILFKNTRVELYSGDVYFIDGTIEAKPGELIAVIGENGVGKTLLLTILASKFSREASNKPYDSVKEIDYSSMLISEVPNNLITSWVRQEPYENFVCRCSADEIILPFLHPEYTHEVILDKIENIVGKADLANKSLLEQDILSYSSGQAQKLAVCVALAPEPKLLLLDEAFARLDNFQQELLAELIKSSINNCITFIATHQLSSMQKIFKSLKLNVIELKRDQSNTNLIKIEQIRELIIDEINFDINDFINDKLQGFTLPVEDNYVTKDYIPRNSPKIIRGCGKSFFAISDLSIHIKSDFSINVQNTQISAGLNVVLGENGAGKTSFGEFITGLLPLNPMVSVFKMKRAYAKINYDKSYDYTLRYLRQSGKTAFLPAESGKWLSEQLVEKEILLFRSTNTIDDTTKQILESANINLSYDINRLSSGQRKLVSILSLCDDLEIVFLDEPFTDLSQRTMKVVFDYILDKIKNDKWKSVFLSTASVDYFKYLY